MTGLFGLKLNINLNLNLNSDSFSFSVNVNVFSNLECPYILMKLPHSLLPHRNKPLLYLYL